ncbi:hypothetical protein ANCCAN_02263 [Ancylostoma caninum]|uniref:Uncharacterized protein n=1 Tax=Ancylostoma caninum TaxID=29170 RepID=A0A368H4S5_ANCCA|nr:hypothetical protein ANCCAN_02263 [Ancylostoma caninum]
MHENILAPFLSCSTASGFDARLCDVLCACLNPIVTPLQRCVVSCGAVFPVFEDVAHLCSPEINHI